MSRFAVIVAFAATASADWTGLLGLEFESDVPVERRGMHCPSGYITGMEVKHGRRAKRDERFEPSASLSRAPADAESLRAQES